MSSKQREYEARVSAYHRAVEARDRYRAEIDAAEVSVGLRREELDTARAALQRTWELFLERPDVVTDHEEKRTYAAAKAAHEEAVSLLSEKRGALATAEADVATKRTALGGYEAELKSLNVQLASARYEVLQERLSQEKTVIVREELGCEKLTVRACQEGALERAKRAAVERVSAVLVESETVMEELRVFAGTGAAADERQVTQTLDRISSKVRGMLVEVRSGEQGLGRRGELLLRD